MLNKKSKIEIHEEVKKAIADEKINLSLEIIEKLEKIHRDVFSTTVSTVFSVLGDFHIPLEGKYGIWQDDEVKAATEIGERLREYIANKSIESLNDKIEESIAGEEFITSIIDRINSMQLKV